MEKRPTSTSSLSRGGSLGEAGVDVLHFEELLKVLYFEELLKMRNFTKKLLEFLCMCENSAPRNVCGANAKRCVFQHEVCHVLRFSTTITYTAPGGGGHSTFFQVGVCGPDFRSVGLAN